MAHFTSQEKLKGILHPASVEALFKFIPPDQSTTVIDQVDRLITLKSGVEPASTNDALLENIAGLIVIEQLSLQHQGLDEKEMQRRTNLADKARTLLDEIANGTLQLTEASTGSVFSDDWLDDSDNTPASRNMGEW